MEQKTPQNFSTLKNGTNHTTNTINFWYKKEVNYVLTQIKTNSALPEIIFLLNYFYLMSVIYFTSNI